MPPPPGTPTEPRSMRGAHPSLPLPKPSSPANSPGKRDRNASFGRRPDRPSVTAAHEDIIMGNTSEAERMPPPPRPPTATAASEPPIPRLRSLAPAIFVPIDKILPSQEAMEEFVALAQTDRVAHMRKALEQCDRHAAAVRGNILALFRREEARLMQVALAQDAAAGYSRDDPRYDPQMRHGVSWWPASKTDLERMIANMAAPEPSPPPAPPARSSASDVVAKVLQAQRGRSGSRGGGAHAPGDVIGYVPEPSFTHRPVPTPRAHAAREALVLVAKATAELHGYDAHIATRREERRRAIDREIAQRSRSQPPAARVVPMAPMAPMGNSVREAERDRSVRPSSSHNAAPNTRDDTRRKSGGGGDHEQKQNTTPRDDGTRKRPPQEDLPPLRPPQPGRSAPPHTSAATRRPPVKFQLGSPRAAAEPRRPSTSTTAAPARGNPARRAPNNPALPTSKSGPTASARHLAKPQPKSILKKTFKQ